MIVQTMQQAVDAREKDMLAIKKDYEGLVTSANRALTSPPKDLEVKVRQLTDDWHKIKVMVQDLKPSLDSQDEHFLEGQFITLLLSHC